MCLGEKFNDYFIMAGVENVASIDHEMHNLLNLTYFILVLLCVICIHIGTDELFMTIYKQVLDDGPLWFQTSEPW